MQRLYTLYPNTTFVATPPTSLWYSYCTSLYKIFVKHAKKSPQQLLLAYRIQLAKNYLRNPSLSIKTISNELGFSNPNHFSTLFKKSIGMSPKEYRLTIFDEKPVQLIQEETEKCSCESQ